jgi:hypothetical protein
MTSDAITKFENSDMKTSQNNRHFLTIQVEMFSTFLPIIINLNLNLNLHIISTKCRDLGMICFVVRSATKRTTSLIASRLSIIVAIQCAKHAKATEDEQIRVQFVDTKST